MISESLRGSCYLHWDGRLVHRISLGSWGIHMVTLLWRIVVETGDAEHGKEKMGMEFGGWGTYKLPLGI